MESAISGFLTLIGGLSGLVMMSFPLIALVAVSVWLVKRGRKQ